MYLKSIEIYGFKSFANKIIFEFHNGITGIVGPNGSGKSNVSDAVRWVLGEQSARLLRGANMQDVIFVGSENRKPLGYAYVAITMDNSDHLLPIDYEEVTIARRVYRSGESEYLLNGSPCRLKDVNELFYDTGIGKEGYSIIGQGQIERILSGKPEERRELFDEAVGIVKFKKRKAQTIKKLENERENLARINDILSELEKRVGPLERQSEAAKIYLKRRDELKNLEVNKYLLDSDELVVKSEEVTGKIELSNSQKADIESRLSNMEESFTTLETSIAEVDSSIETIRNTQSENTITKGRLSSQITILEEQINFIEENKASFDDQKQAIDGDIEGFGKELEDNIKLKEELNSSLEDVRKRLATTTESHDKLLADIKNYSTIIDESNEKKIENIKNKSSVDAEIQKIDTLKEQINIRKAELTGRLLKRKSQDEELEISIEELTKELKNSEEKLNSANDNLKETSERVAELTSKKNSAQDEILKIKEERTKASSRLDVIKNVAERYEGYGGAIRAIMKGKDAIPGIVGPISDLISVDHRYETAIETALASNIQNIVTLDEDAAKKAIKYLRDNSAGRATFLPLTNVKYRHNSKLDEYRDEDVVIGMASELVKCDDKYSDIIAYLLGRVFVVENIDDASKLAKRARYSVHIVSLKGDYFAPGGSMAGGKFKNNNNLLARNRQIEELEASITSYDERLSDLSKRAEELDVAISLTKSDEDEAREAINAIAVEYQSNKLELDKQLALKNEKKSAYDSLTGESQNLDAQLSDIIERRDELENYLVEISKEESRLEELITETSEKLDEATYMETASQRALSEATLEESEVSQREIYINETIERISSQIDRRRADLDKLILDQENSDKNIDYKKAEIAKIKETLSLSDEGFRELEEKLTALNDEKEVLNKKYKEYFTDREKLNVDISNLDKEIYRLNSFKERYEETLNKQRNYIWEEYELTPRKALEFRDESLETSAEVSKKIGVIRDEIRSMGHINVGAIEEFAEVNERYTFLKTQHDDLIEAEQSLLGIIDDLDEGMRAQFNEGFANIKREFDLAFKELFGGGKGTLELVEDEDVLETGIRIIAQPPGKKLQNMMQLSGGEKSLTAIALLFAIQNLKPSPFCLLDEIEAALDDSNVGRFSKYLNKLTKNTQFIIITHRRGTMNAADRLYGITMQEKGVSALVSVNLIEDKLDE